MKKICPLCSGESKLFYKETQSYFRCLTCKGIFVDEKDLSDRETEKEVYEQHDVDTDDKGYRKFVSPITEAIVKDFSPKDQGLDFGAGRSKIIWAVLSEEGYDLKNYDPLFHNDRVHLEKKYDYISSCEVVEHFYKPYKEFKMLKSMLQEKGKLYIMTDLYDERDFASWYYKNDPTHVFFYTKETFLWIVKEFGFEDVQVEKRFVILY